MGGGFHGCSHKKGMQHAITSSTKTLNHFCFLSLWGQGQGWLTLIWDCWAVDLGQSPRLGDTAHQEGADEEKVTPGGDRSGNREWPGGATGNDQVVPKREGQWSKAFPGSEYLPTRYFPQRLLKILLDAFISEGVHPWHPSVPALSCSWIFFDTKCQGPLQETHLCEQEGARGGGVCRSKVSRMEAATFCRAASAGCRLSCQLQSRARSELPAALRQYFLLPRHEGAHCVLNSSPYKEFSFSMWKELWFINFPFYYLL